MNWNRIYNFQILIGIGLLSYILFDDSKKYGWSSVWVIIEIILIGAFTIYLILNKFHFWDKFKNFLSLTILTFGILWAYTVFLYKLSLIFKDSKLILQYIYIVLGLIILIPSAYAIYGTIKVNWIRLLSLPVLVESIFFGVSDVKSNNLILNDFISSNLIFGFALIIFSSIVVKEWGIKFKFSLKENRNLNFQWSILIVLILFSIWYTFAYGMINTAENLSQVFWNFNFKILDIKNSSSFDAVPRIIFTAMEAGVLEETYRYLLIIASLLLFKKSKRKLQLTILVSTIFFGLMHYDNIFTEHREFGDVTLQVCLTFGYGCFMAVLYLYTGKIWWNMLIHGLNDLLAFSQSYISFGLGVLAETYGLNAWQLCFLGMLVPILFTIFMLFGKRKKYMEENANRLIEPLV